MAELKLKERERKGEKTLFNLIMSEGRVLGFDDARESPTIRCLDHVTNL